MAKRPFDANGVATVRSEGKANFLAWQCIAEDYQDYHVLVPKFGILCLWRDDQE